MSTTPDGNTYFYVCFGAADLKFGVPTAMAEKITESTRSAVRKAKIDLAVAIANGEKAILDMFRKELHRKPKASKKLAPIIISCCLLSEEALASPQARGFILEISHSPLPSWSPDATGEAADDASGNEAKTYVHYRALAGKADIDALMASRRAAAVAATPG